MCAIVGIRCDVRDDEWGSTYGLMTQLLVEAAERGVDACGFAAATQPYAGASQGPRHLRQGGGPVPRVRPAECDMAALTTPTLAIVGHTRAACSGSATDPTTPTRITGSLAHQTVQSGA